MTRRVTAAIVMICLALLVFADFMATPPNPYAAPSIIALGSGEASASGFCGELPNP